jgi:hypothetical protein
MNSKVLVLGDSHAGVFSDDSIRAHYHEYELEVVSIGGATVSGLSNPNSQTQAMPLFKSAIDATSAKLAIFLIGEVDTGFVIWHHAQRNQVDIHTALERALTNYQELINYASRKLQTLCISTPLPTIKDGQDFGQIANARKEITATQRERTLLTIEFNCLMEKFCRGRNIPYINLDTASLGPDGLVSAELLHPDPADHHYNPQAYAKLISSRLSIKTSLEQLPIAGRPGSRDASNF